MSTRALPDDGHRPEQVSGGAAGQWKFTDERVRRDLFSAASELAYLAGWMAFDGGQHATAQRYFAEAVKLAAEAGDPPMAAHVLRAMAHQAIDLGHHQQALNLAACALRDIGDLDGSVREFHHCVRTRKATKFTRTHAVTLGYLGSVYVQMNNIDRACATWSQALDAMDGVRSGRTRQAAAGMRTLLSPYRRRGTAAITEIDARAAAYLTETA